MIKNVENINRNTPNSLKNFYECYYTQYKFLSRLNVFYNKECEKSPLFEKTNF